MYIHVDTDNFYVIVLFLYYYYYYYRFDIALNGVYTIPQNRYGENYLWHFTRLRNILIVYYIKEMCFNRFLNCYKLLAPLIWFGNAFQCWAAI